MYKRILTFFHSYRRELAAVAISVAVFVTLLSFPALYLNKVSAFLIKDQVAKIDTITAQELSYLSQQREEIIASKVLNDALKSGDSAKLLSIAQSEALRRGLDFIVVTDKDGFVLARSHLPGQIGDNVFQTTIQGPKIATGETVTAVIRGVNNPLVPTSGSLILEDGKSIGALILGDIINNNYADKIQQKYLDENSHVLFYTTRAGLIGSSLDDPETNRLLGVLFSPGSDLVTYQMPQLENELKINGKYYYARNIVFPGLDRNISPGGAIVLLSVSHVERCLLLASLITLLFLVAYWFLSRFSTFHREKRHPNLVVLLVIAIFAGTYVADIIRLDLVATELKNPSYPIYNSTLSFQPESQTIHPLVKTSVAIQLLTGGEAINDVRATIQYDPAKLKVLDVLTTNSVCSPDGVLEKTVDSKAGIVKINCVTQNISPGFYQPQGTVAALSVLPLVEGGVSLKFVDSTQVLAADGFETNVLRSVTNAFYEVTRQGLTTLNIKDTIPVFSPDHPNSNRWYRNKNIQLSWPVLSGGTYYYALNQTPDVTPGEGEASTTGNYLNTIVDRDGVYYFHIRDRDANEHWGPVSHFKIMVDATPPPAPIIKSSAVKTGSGELVRLTFSAEDDMSGVQKNFYVRFDNGMWFPTLSQLFVPFFSGEKHTVYLRVFDNAGNFGDASEQISAP
ncbi:hypothetical protein KGQ72_02635 [Patescibacteria group bacterium]|nr:hypothetical protein [Patescibacteria group bacterium]